MSYFSCSLHKDSFGFFFTSVSVTSINVGPSLSWSWNFTPEASFFGFGISDQHRLCHNSLVMQNALCPLWTGVKLTKSPVCNAVGRLFAY